MQTKEWTRIPAIIKSGSSPFSTWRVLYSSTVEVDSHSLTPPLVWATILALLPLPSRKRISTRVSSYLRLFPTMKISLQIVTMQSNFSLFIRVKSKQGPNGSNMNCPLRFNVGISERVVQLGSSIDAKIILTALEWKSWYTLTIANMIKMPLAMLRKNQWRVLILSVHLNKVYSKHSEPIESSHIMF